MSAQDFELQPADRRLLWLLPGTALAAVAIGIGVLMTREPHAWVAFPILIPAVVIVAVGLSRRRVRMERDVLTIAAGLNTRRIATADLRLTSARVVDLREHREFKPAMKLFGTRVPGFSGGTSGCAIAAARSFCSPDSPVC